MNSTDLPLLPSTPVVDPEVCEVVSLYLAVSHDLNEDQKRRVSAHLQICQRCVNEYHLVRRAAQLVNSLEETEPSARVDVAVMAAIAARAAASKGASNAPRPLRSTTTGRLSGRSRPVRRSRIPMGGLVAAAAVLVVAFVGLMNFVIMPPKAGAFQVPASAWNGVLYHTQTVVESDATYHITSYHDMTTDRMNVETVVNGKLDVMAVSDGKNTVVGMDMMHDVTSQANAKAWLVNDSLFDVKKLNADLKTGRAKYLGKSQYNGQSVYQVRDASGDIILLDMSYKPVNVLQAVSGSSTAKPMYDKLQLLSAAPAGTWDMNPPANFKQGQLPART